MTSSSWNLSLVFCVVSVFFSSGCDIDVFRLAKILLDSLQMMFLLVACLDILCSFSGWRIVPWIFCWQQKLG